MLYREKTTKHTWTALRGQLESTVGQAELREKKKGKLVPVSSAPLERGIALGCDLGAHENHR